KKSRPILHDTGRTCHEITRKSISHGFIRDTSAKEIRIRCRWRRELVETCQLFLTNFQVCCPKVVFKLCEFIRTEKHGADERFTQHQSYSTLRGSRLVCCSDSARTIDQLIALLLVIWEHVEAGQAASVTRGFFASVLPAQETARQRTPDENA